MGEEEEGGAGAAVRAEEAQEGDADAEVTKRPHEEREALTKQQR